MSTAIEFAFAVGDPILILGPNYPGQVTGCMVDSTGLQYRIVWWKDGERKCEWLYAFELETRL